MDAPGPHNGIGIIGIVGKCLGPTTSNGEYERWLRQSISNVLCIVSTKLPIFTLKHQFHLMRSQVRDGGPIWLPWDLHQLQSGPMGAEPS